MGLDLIFYLQRLSPGLDGVMTFLSFLGREEFFLLLIPFVYWCIDAALGLRLLAVLVFSDFVNGLCKWAFHAPRPYWVDARVKALSVETSYGVPSGHAQNAMGVWTTLARGLTAPWAWVAAVVLVLGISLSRIYLGVHFPHDVVAGWAIGGGVLMVSLWAEPRLARWLKPQSVCAQIAAAFVLSMAMVGLVLAARAALAGVVDPPAWAAQVAAQTPGGSVRGAGPRSLDGFLVDIGMAFGAGAGLALMRRYAPFDARGPWRKRIPRLIVGLVLLINARIVLGAVFPREPETVAMIFRFIRYAFLGLWTVWLTPWVFLKMNLADHRRS